MGYDTHESRRGEMAYSRFCFGSRFRLALDSSSSVRNEPVSMKL